jgi:hypothetical protein
MADMDSLNRRSDDIPEENSATKEEKLSNADSGESSEETAAAAAQVVDEARPEGALNVQVDDDSQPSASTDEDEAEAA